MIGYSESLYLGKIQESRLKKKSRVWLGTVYEFSLHIGPHELTLMFCLLFC